MKDGSAPTEDWVRTSNEVSAGDRRQMGRIIQRVADFGFNYRNPEHLKLLDDEKEGGKAAKGLYEMRGHQLRLIGVFSGRRFLILHGVIKKTDRLGKDPIERANYVRRNLAETEGEKDAPWVKRP